MGGRSLIAVFSFLLMLKILAVQKIGSEDRFNTHPLDPRGRLCQALPRPHLTEEQRCHEVGTRSHPVPCTLPGPREP